MSTPQTTPPLSNSFADLMETARELGEQAGRGKDTQIKFALKIVDAAFHQRIDIDPNKHGLGVDDAEKLTEAYVKAQNSAVVFDSLAANQRKAVSCTRTLIRLGMWPKGGQGEPMASVNNFVTERQKLRADPKNSKKLDDAFNSLLKFARTQIKRDQLIPTQERQGFMFKSQPAFATTEECYAAIRKAAQNIKSGKASHNTVLDKSPEVDAIIKACTDRIASLRKPATQTATNGVTPAKSA